MNNNRISIIGLYQCKKSPAEIAKTLKIHRQTVHRAIKRYNELGTLCDRPKKGPKKTVDIAALRRKLKTKLKSNPRSSLRKISKKLNVNRETVRKIVKNVLKLKAYKLQKAHGLTEKIKQQRLKKCKQLIKNPILQNWETIVFSDEKIFTIEQKINKQNDRFYASQLSEAVNEARKVPKTKKPSSIMVWGAITSNGKAPLVFIEKGEKMTKEYYCKEILEKNLLPWAKGHFKNKRWTFQQDSAPCHTAKITKEWCYQNLPSFISAEQWPSNSPDLNPMDYSIWGILESKACSSQHTSLQSLKSNLIAEWNKIDENMLKNITKTFNERLRRVINAKGGYIEN